MRLIVSSRLLPIGSHYKSILSAHPILEMLPKKMKAWVTYKGERTLREEVLLQWTPKFLPAAFGKNISISIEPCS